MHPGRVPGARTSKGHWISLSDIYAGYHTIEIVQDVSGKIVITHSPRFFIKGTAQLLKPAATIRSGPSGTVGTSVVFDVHVDNTQKAEYWLDSGKWKLLTERYVRYDRLAPGPHLFELRAYAGTGSGYAEAKRSFTVAG